MDDKKYAILVLEITYKVYGKINSLRHNFPLAYVDMDFTRFLKEAEDRFIRVMGSKHLTRENILDVAIMNMIKVSKKEFDTWPKE